MMQETQGSTPYQGRFFIKEIFVERHFIKVTFADGNVIETWINGTEDEIRQYYLGKFFNFGDTDWGVGDNMQQAISVEFLG